MNEYENRISRIDETINKVVKNATEKRRRTMAETRQLPVFSVTPRENGRSFYQRVGTAFEDDGGLNVLLNAVPLSGRLRIKNSNERELPDGNDGSKNPFE
jgi:hypothetical protein